MVVLAAGLMISKEGIAAWRRSLVVRQLLDPAKRNEAWREVVGWQRYGDGNPHYQLKLYSDQEVREVLACPQPRGKPLFAVFFGDMDTVPSSRNGNFELVRMDGTLLPDPHGWDLAENPFRDLNGDSVLDRVESMTFEFEHDANDEPRCSAAVLHVIPLTESREPTLMVVCGRKGAPQLKWRLRESNRPGVFDVVLEKSGEGKAQDAIKAVYRWSERARAYEGPGGSAAGDFLRVDLDPGARSWSSLDRIEEFARSGTP